MTRTTTHTTTCNETSVYSDANAAYAVRRRRTCRVTVSEEPEEGHITWTWHGQRQSNETDTDTHTQSAAWEAQHTHMAVDSHDEMLFELWWEG